ncbi:frizzled-1-like [Oscarella lobularis]|uniref:frizzled-1-like n=1 Tax=Oscarella lobularis TaxID=121494 RepID=UPI00331333FF
MFTGIFLFAAAAILPLPAHTWSKGPSTYRCETVTEPRCRQFYNRTLFPNDLFHDTQAEAGKIFADYDPLINTNCSDSLLILLCSRYYPYCLDDNKTLPPCRELCECARKGCEPVVRGHQRPWPDDLDCEKFPNSTSGELCIHNFAPCDPTPTPTVALTTRSSNETSSTFRATTSSTAKATSSMPTMPTTTTIRSCKAPLFVSQRKMDAFAGIEYCKSSCNGPFSDEQLDSGSKWLVVLSVLCLVCVLFALPARCVEKRRFRGTEQAVFYLVACLMVVSVGFIVGASLRRQSVACEEVEANRTAARTSDRFKDSVPCIATFILTYYFSMAAGFWWMLLSLQWFLVTAMDWTEKDVSLGENFHHFYVWFTSLCLSVIVFAMSALDGDVLANVCSPGNQNETFLTGFVITPIMAILVTSLLLFASGIVQLVARKQKRQPKEKPPKSDSATKDTERKSVASAAATAAAVTVAAQPTKAKPSLPFLFAFNVINATSYIILASCYFYERAARLDAESQLNTLNCLEKKTCSKQSQIFSIALLKYAAVLLPGIAVPFWAWASKFRLVVRYYWAPKECTRAFQRPVVVVEQSSTSTYV